MTHLNYRIEFYGGPNDGEVTYQHSKPSITYELANKIYNELSENWDVLLHQYELSWINPAQAKYIYKGVRHWE